jgi:probable F420-dependent oxidoreductase
VRFGLQLPTYGAVAGPRMIARVARQAEELGYDSVWVNDHVLVPPSVVRYRSIFEALSTLAWVAGSSRRIKLGTSALILPQREAVLAAKQLATIDVLSEGRLVVGLGAGYLAEEFSFLRARFERRGAVIEEQIALLRALWSGARSFRGELISFDDAAFGPTPAQGERVPVWLGGSSDAAVTRAARLADAWHPAHLDPNTLAEKCAHLRALASGRNVGVALKLRLYLTAPGAPARERPPGLPGNAELCGSARQIREQIQAYAPCRLEELVVVLPHDDEQELEWAIHSFATHVMPAFR